MSTSRLVHLVVALALAVARPTNPAAAAPPADDHRPNIVVIVLDDLGYSDLGCYGGEIRTPNIDRLAAGGLRLTRFYNASRCCPSRAALLTGLYPHQVGLARNGHDLTRDGATIAELLREAGYRTAMAGKWLRLKASGRSLGRVTVSIGCSQFRPGESPAELLERTDQALYEAKRQGRNRVVAKVDTAAGRVA